MAITVSLSIAEWLYNQTNAGKSKNKSDRIKELIVKGLLFEQRAESEKKFDDEKLEYKDKSKQAWRDLIPCIGEFSIFHNAISDTQPSINLLTL